MHCLSYIYFQLGHYGMPIKNCIFSFNHTIICPKAFRLGAEERVVLNLHGYEAATINAKLQVRLMLMHRILI